MWLELVTTSKINHSPKYCRDIPWQTHSWFLVTLFLSLEINKKKKVKTLLLISFHLQGGSCRNPFSASLLFPMRRAGNLSGFALKERERMSLRIMFLPTSPSRNSLIRRGQACQALTERAGVRWLFCDLYIYVTLAVTGMRNSYEKSGDCLKVCLPEETDVV